MVTKKEREQIIADYNRERCRKAGRGNKGIPRTRDDPDYYKKIGAKGGAAGRGKNKPRKIT
jgi:hypothetical protein